MNTSNANLFSTLTATTTPSQGKDEAVPLLPFAQDTQDFPAVLHDRLIQQAQAGAETTLAEIALPLTPAPVPAPGRLKTTPALPLQPGKAAPVVLPLQQTKTLPTLPLQPTKVMPTLPLQQAGTATPALPLLIALTGNKKQQEIAEIAFPQSNLQYNESAKLPKDGLPSGLFHDVSAEKQGDDAKEASPFPVTDSSSGDEKVLDHITEDSNSSSSLSSGDSSSNTGSSQQEEDLVSSSPLIMSPNNTSNNPVLGRKQDISAPREEAAFTAFLEQQKARARRESEKPKASEGSHAATQKPSSQDTPKESSAQGTSLLKGKLRQASLQDQQSQDAEQSLKGFDAIMDNAILVTDAIQFTPTAAATSILPDDGNNSDNAWTIQTSQPLRQSLFAQNAQADLSLEGQTDTEAGLTAASLTDSNAATDTASTQTGFVIPDGMTDDGLPAVPVMHTANAAQGAAAQSRAFVLQQGTAQSSNSTQETVAEALDKDAVVTARQDIAPTPVPTTAAMTEASTHTATQSVTPVTAPQAMEQSAAFNRLSQQLGSEAWNQALGQRMLWMATNGQHTASLTLSPADLGPMHIVLQVQNEQASVMFYAQNADTRQALEDAMPKLRDMMNQAGVQLGNAEVNSNNPGQQQMAQQESGNSRQLGGQDGAGDDDIVDVPANIIRTGNNVGLVDTFA